MAINSHVFQAAGTIYQALLGHVQNRMPQNPEHAYRAHYLASMLYDAAKKDAILTNVAARVMCGFMRNDQSAHASNEELVAWAIEGTRHLIGAFQRSAAAPPPPPPPAQWAPQPSPHAASPWSVPVVAAPQAAGPQPVPTPLPVMPAAQPVQAPPAPPQIPAQYAPPPAALDVPDFSDGST